MLDRSEYVEQAYLFDLLRQRSDERAPMQELLDQLRHELLATTKLPMAIDFMSADLRHRGLMAGAMAKLSHYFAPFQTFLIDESESETGRFTIGLALQILHVDAKMRADFAAALEVGDVADDAMRHRRCGMFFFQFESLCRNRLGYDRGLTAMAGDPAYDDRWRGWLLDLRRQVGLVDLADLLFLASAEYTARRNQAGIDPPANLAPELFGQKEGRIALANRRKNPVYLFGAMHRHLDYPAVPRPEKRDESEDVMPALMRRVERLESRIQLMEAEAKQQLDITKFYVGGKKP